MDDALLAELDEIVANGGFSPGGQSFYKRLLRNPPDPEDLQQLMERFSNSENPNVQAALAGFLEEMQDEEPDPSLSNGLFRLIEGTQAHWEDPDDPRLISNFVMALGVQARNDIPWVPLEDRPDCVFPFLVVALRSPDSNIAENARHALWCLRLLAEDEQGLVKIFSREEREQFRDVLSSAASDNKPLIDALGL